MIKGDSACAVAQTVSRRLPMTGGPGFDPGTSHVGVCGGHSGTEAGFHQYFGFLRHSFIPPIVLQSSPSIIQGWHNRPVNGRSSSGLGSTPAP
jgi:hypothetical protein